MASRTARWTLSDRLVSWLDPARGVERWRARKHEALAGGYNGAKRTRRQTDGWAPGGGSANADQLPDLPALRERSRDLMRNAPLALGAVSTVVTNVVGTGLAVQPAIDAELLGLSRAQADAWQAAAKREFRLWAESKLCDVTRTQNFYGLQDLCFRSSLENGDTIVLTPVIRTPESPYGLKLQLVEADRLCNPEGRADSPELAGGIAIDQYGAPQTYHIMRSHPGELGRIDRKWDAIPARGASTGRRNVLHVYRRVRIGQLRGMPYLAPIIELLKQISTYSENEITASVVSSLFTVFIRTQDGADIQVPLDGAPGVADPYDPSKFKLGPGAALALAEGDTVEFANPLRPNSSFDAFMMAALKQFSMALELPLEVLIKHFTSSYTAARGAFLEAWKFFKVRRGELATDFCQPVYELLIDEAVALGRLAAPGYFRDAAVRAAYLRAEWVGDGPGSIDPLKEAEAAEKRMAIRVSTLQKESMAYDGSNWEDNIAQSKREREAIGDLPDPPKPAAASDPAADPAAPNAPVDDNEELP